ncbi:ABC transporter permease [Actinokineospora auranticolor]|uniref:ABC-2 type transport system permease protein n=1 Tax=Actinokineospora auranticolor TaxID=155976 RepID=A0A2S6GRZ0_9PSEU|nr:ABC transporter permease [Actinokineospora auranticolor]PPK68012.1 ABC-2 type transport system permease protein [Actinokineospora auranticolor]
MTLLAVERMKLFSTRSPWWCSLIALALTVGFGALMAGTANTETPLTVAATQFGYTFGLVVIMVMAALAITTEYRFGTIRATFLAVPNRGKALLAKTAVVAILAGVLGELAAFGSWGIGKLIKPASDLALNTPYEWRAVAGVGLVYAVAAVIAVAVGVLVRHSAGAIALLLVYVQLVENLVSLIPRIGNDIHRWMPFTMSAKFITGDPDVTLRNINEGPPLADAGLSPWPALLYFAGFAVVMMVIALAVANRRDA